MMLKNVIVDLLLLVGCRHFSGTFYVNNDLSALYRHLSGTRIPVHDLLDSVGRIWLISANIDAQLNLAADKRWFTEIRMV